MVSATKPVLCIITPGTRRANNGNWRTADRWAHVLRDRYRVIVQSVWDGRDCAAMIALHARRSAESIAHFHAGHGPERLAVVLTGTDLYRDLPSSAEARHSLDVAGTLVVLHEEATRDLRARWRGKAHLILQSATALRAPRPKAPPLRLVAVGHLREEKDPRTLFAAIARLPKDLAVRIRHVGAPLDKALEKLARGLAAREPRYAYSGALAPGAARRAIAAAHALVHPSAMEGGANVVAEAVTSGTPVIASHIPGNIGMLGRGYRGYFPAGDAASLASLIERAAGEPAFLAKLCAACAARKALFSPAAEARAVHALARSLLERARR
jgi:putative glycosyltransferase (TIGR04348 family)